MASLNSEAFVFYEERLSTMNIPVVVPTPPPKKELLVEIVKDVVKQVKTQGHKSNSEALIAARKENLRLAPDFGVSLSEEELADIAYSRSRRSSRLDCAAEITMQPPEWLWEGRLSKNQLTHCAGESSQGKSPVTLDLVARVTTGSEWPDGLPNTLGPRSVIIMASEDDWADTIVPRLRLAGANMEKVFRFASIVTKDESTVVVSTKLDSDLEELKRQLITLPDVGLVVIDPITNYLGSKSMNKEEDIRSILMPLSEQIAQALKVCVVTVGHLNKQGKDASTKQRVMGAAAFIGVARNLIMFAADPDETSKKYHHIMGEERNQSASTLKYHTEMVPVDWDGWEGKKVLRVVWDGVSTASMDESINPDKEEVKHAIELAAPALKLVMQAGKVQSEQCKESVLGGVYKDKPDNFWHRVRKKAGVVSKQEGRQWWWMLEAAPSLVEQFDSNNFCLTE
jgi:putative DNA primase/helicase